MIILTMGSFLPFCIDSEAEPVIETEDTNIPVFKVMDHQIGSYPGTIYYVGGSGPGNYTTIQQGVDAASDGDMVLLSPKTYYETIMITSEIWIMGNGSTISPPLEINPVAFTLNADNVTITDLMIRGYYVAIQSTYYGHNITNNVFSDNQRDLIIDVNINDIHTSRSFSGIRILDNIIMRSSPSSSMEVTVSLISDNENTTNIKTGDVILSGNDFTSSSLSGDLFYFSMNVMSMGGGSLDIGNFKATDNEMSGAGRGIYFFSDIGMLTDVKVTVGDFIILNNNITDFGNIGLALDYYNVNTVYGSTNIRMGEVRIYNNLLRSDNPASGITIPAYSLWSNFNDDSSMICGNLTISNNIIDVLNEGVEVFFILPGINIYDNVRVISQNTYISNNWIKNSRSGIYVEIDRFEALYENVTCSIGDITIINNTVNSTSIPVTVNGYGLGNDMHGNSSFMMGDITITENDLMTDMYSTLANGISFNMNKVGHLLYDNSSVSIGIMKINKNSIHSYQGISFSQFLKIGSELYGWSSFSMKGINVSENNIWSESYGITIHTFSEFGSNLYGSSTVQIREIGIKKNAIWSHGDGIFINHLEEFGYRMSDLSSMTMMDIVISENNIWSSSGGIHIYQINTWGVLMTGGSSFTFGSIYIHDNFLWALEQGIMIESISNLGLELWGTATFTMEDIDISHNKIRSEYNGIHLESLDTFGTHIYEEGSFEMGSIMIRDNDVISNETGVFLSQVFNIGCYLMDNASFSMEDISIMGNSIKSLSYGIYIGYTYLVGSFLEDNSSYQGGSVSLTENSVVSGDQGIHIEYINSFGSFLTGEATFQMQDIMICGNGIISENEGALIQNIGTIGYQLSGYSSTTMGVISLSENIVRTNLTGIMLSDISQIGIWMEDATVVKFGGIHMNNNSVNSKNDGVVLGPLSYFGNENSGNSVSEFGNITLDGNTVDSGNRGVGFDNLRTFFSHLTDSANSVLGTISFVKNDIISEGAGVFLNNIMNTGQMSRDSSWGMIEGVRIKGNSIRSNGSAIESNAHNRFGNELDGSAIMSMGAWKIEDNDIHADDYGLDIDHDMIGDGMISGQVVLEDLIISNNRFDTGKGIRTNYTTSTLTSYSNVTIGDVNLIDNTFMRTSDQDMVLVNFKTDARSYSRVKIGSTLIEGNGRLSSNLSGIHIAYSKYEQGSGISRIGPVNIISNNITDCGTGIELEGVVTAEIYLNNFINNLQDLELGSTSVSLISPHPIWYRHGMKNFSSELGNYWDTYFGPDLNDDGIGDNPFNTGSGTDTKPLVKGTWNYLPPWNDITPPDVRIISPGNGSFLRSQNITLNWESIDDLLGIEKHWVRSDNGPWIDVGMSHSHDFTYLTEGPHTLTVRARDMAGNEEQVSVTITIDLTGPDIHILSPVTGSAFNVTSIQLSWSGSDPLSGISGYSVAIGNGSFSDLGMSTSTVLTGLTEGMHHISLKATDNVGNHMTEMITIFIDLTPPEIGFIHPEMDMVIIRDRLNASWYGLGGLTPMASYQISIDGDNSTDKGEVTFHLFEDLSTGQHVLYLIGSDLAGNRNSTSVTFTVDITAPGVVILYPGDGSRINSTSIEANWGANGLIHPVERVEYRLDGGTWTPGVNDYAILTNLSEDDHTLDVRAIDSKGNTAVATSHFTVDITLPIIVSISHEGTSAVAKGPIVIVFSEEMASGYAILNGVELEKELIGSTLSLEMAKMSPGTTYTLELTARDLAGNEIKETLTFTTAFKGTVSGRIVDKNGDPVPGARVVFDSGEEVTVNDDGSFSVEVEAGSRTAKVYDKDGNEIGSFDFEVIGGDDNETGDIEVEPKEKEEGSNWWIAIVVAVAIMLLLMAVIAFILISKGKETEEEEFEDDEWENEDFDDEGWDDDEF